MATRSLIGKQNTDGSIRAIYCHWNGDITGVGATLVEYYDEAKLEMLLDGGDISSLCGDPAATSFYRHRGETNVDAKVYENLANFIEACKNYDAEYAYLYKNGVWSFAWIFGGDEEFADVKMHIETNKITVSPRQRPRFIIEPILQRWLQGQN